jgi:hypothetical protein
MTSYVYTATGTPQVSANIGTSSVQIATTTGAIQYATGWPNTAGNGTVVAATNSNTLTGTSTNFGTQINVGYWIGNATGATVGIVKSIANSTSITLTANANVAISGAGYTFSPYGVPYVQLTANSSIIPAQFVNKRIICGQGNVVAFASVSGSVVFSITELGMPAADTGTTGYILPT